MVAIEEDNWAACVDLIPYLYPRVVIYSRVFISVSIILDHA